MYILSIRYESNNESSKIQIAYLYCRNRMYSLVLQMSMSAYLVDLTTAMATPIVQTAMEVSVVFVMMDLQGTEPFAKVG